MPRAGYSPLVQPFVRPFPRHVFLEDGLDEEDKIDSSLHLTQAHAPVKHIFKRLATRFRQLRAIRGRLIEPMVELIEVSLAIHNILTSLGDEEPEAVNDDFDEDMDVSDQESGVLEDLEA